MKTLLESKSLSELADLLQKRYSFLNRNQGEHNSLGFRDSEIITTADICYYGCSLTYGDGVLINDRWTSLVDAQFNYSSNNFGIPGIGINEILLLFAITSRFVSIKRAVFLLPPPTRQYINGFNVFPNTVSDRLPGKEYAKIWYQLPTEYFIDCANNSIQLILQLAKLQNIQCIFAKWNTYFDITLPELKFNVPEINTKGSDNMHPGTEWHCGVADSLIKIL
jgi:hypothetical protein